MRDPQLGTHQWQTFRKRFIHTVPPICALCGGHVDTRLPGTHPDGPAVDHITPRSRGGAVYDPANCQLTHNHCNAARRNDPITPTNSRHW